MHSEPSHKRAQPRSTCWLCLGFALAIPLLQGCAAVVVGGAAVGAATLHDRRPYYVVIDDQDIELSAMGALNANKDVHDHSRISVTSYNRKVLLTGQADTDAIRALAAGLVSRMPKVERVIDEVTVGPRADLRRQAEDGLITSRAKLALIDISLPHFDPTRIKVVTEDGVVYLMGLVTPEEANATVDKVRFVPGVKRVVKLFEYQQSPT
jgi:osmotically-inducible protein OsmY